MNTSDYLLKLCIRIHDQWISLLSVLDNEEQRYLLLDMINVFLSLLDNIRTLILKHEMLREILYQLTDSVVLQIKSLASDIDRFRRMNVSETLTLLQLDATSDNLYLWLYLCEVLLLDASSFPYELVDTMNSISQ